ncbi:MAG: hypothetical protein FWC80_03390 [Firmicutes bacterium]|nr:hypothetical protein [Bacillota bacterium]
MKKKDIKKNYFTLRINDAETLTLMEELWAAKLYESKNDLLNRALRIGMEELHRKTFKSRRMFDAEVAGILDEDTKNDLIKRLEQIYNGVEDTFVMMTILEYLISTLFNVKALELLGEKVSNEMMLTGLLAELPKALAGIKKEIIGRSQKK